jgi:hypothetical protein
VIRTAPKCRVCRSPVTSWSVHAAVNRFCNVDCATKWSLVEVEEKRRQKAKRVKSAKTPEKLAQDAVNAFIRERDKHKPCIVHGYECPYASTGWHAGHFKSVGSHPELRYNTWNIHKQCASGNKGAHKWSRYERSNDAMYEENLRKRIGDARVDWLKASHPPKQYRDEDLKRIKTLFNRRARLYRKLRA